MTTEPPVATSAAFPGELALPEHVVADTSETSPVHLLAGRNGSFLRLSPSAARMLRMVREGATFDQIAEKASLGVARRVTAADVAASYKGLVERIAAIEARASTPKGLFWLRRRILPKAMVEPAAKRFSVAFHPLVAVLAALLIAGGIGLCLHFGLRSDTAHFWTGYLLFLISLAAHEMGHASACARYGASPGDIGFVMYFLYPAFYSDSTAAWVLKRWQRVVVDLGGVYFQLVIGALYALVYWLSGWEPLRMALLLIAGSCIFSLNPILKFDGYWVISDAMGVTNLGRQPQRIVQHALNRLRGQAVRPLPWSAPVTSILVMYTIASIGFWIWFLWRLVPLLTGHIARTASSVIVFASHFRAEPAWPDSHLVRDAMTSAYVLVFVVLLLGRAFRAGATSMIGPARQSR